MKTNNDPVQMIEIPLAEYEALIALKQEVELLRQQTRWLRQQIKEMQRVRFGRSSEKTTLADGSIQLDLFGAAVLAEQKPPQVVHPVKAHNRRAVRPVKDRLPADVPIEVVPCTLPQEERICPECGEVMNAIGCEIVRQEWKLIPAKVELRQYKRYTYACQSCEKTGITTQIKKAPVPDAVIKGGNASPEGVAYIAIQKFAVGVPLYRQSQEWARNGVFLSRQTLSNWIIKSIIWLKLIYEEMKRQLKLNEVLHADESTLKLLHMEGKNKPVVGYMWQYRTSWGAVIPIVIFEWKPGRGQKYPESFLADWKGYLHTDGYAGYHNLPADIIPTGCWSHVHRMFFKAYNQITDEQVRKDSQASYGLSCCRALFMNEREFKDMSANQRQSERMKRSKPIVDKFFAWVTTTNVSRDTYLGRAIHYARSQRVYLERFLMDGRLEISNNRAERSFKPFVISRKNFLFANSQEGAEAAAIYLSIIETAKENGINLYEYFTRVFRDAPNGVPVDRLLPWKLPVVD